MQILKGQLLDFAEDPSAGEEASYRFSEGGALVIEDGKIVWRGEWANLPSPYRDLAVVDHSDCLVLPGFIDAHLHFPQYRMLAAYAKDLLEWLNTYTFVEEQRYGDPSVAAPAAAIFLDELIRNGTTCCMAFSTIHGEALDCLFEAALTRNMHVISGKTMMDRNAPAGLRDTAESAYEDSQRLIQKWQGQGRLGYAISPRFAVTSTAEQLEVAGALVKAHPDLWMQTHLSENHGEIATVAKDFPEATDYTDVYDRFGLLGNRSYFAHGIHLSARELGRLRESGSTIVHCPTSNNFLGSGLFQYRNAQDAGVRIGMGSDIGGGTGYSMLETMRDAFVVSQLAGRRLSAFDAFYGATLGNARALGLADSVGTLDIGSYGDLVVLDPQATPIMKERHALSTKLHDILFALLIMGDDRCVRETYIAGKPLKSLKNKKE